MIRFVKKAGRLFFSWLKYRTDFADSKKVEESGEERYYFSETL